MKNSVIFWNSLYVIGLIVFGFVFLEGLMIYLGIKSLLFFGSCLDGNAGSDSKNFRGYYINFFTVIVGIIWCIFMGGNWLHKEVIKPIYNRTFRKFNKFLNGE